MGRRRCCCGCPVYEDNFNRDNSDDIGNWTEEVGEWAILDNELTEAGNPGAIAIYDTTLPSNWMGAGYDIVDEQVGDIYVIYLSWKDASHHLYARYKKDTAYAFTLELHRVDGGDTLLDSTSFNYAEPDRNPRSFAACVNIHGFACMIDDESTCFAFAPSEEIAGGLQAGIGHLNFHACYFDEWTMGERDSGTNGCPKCWECDCQDNHVAYYLTATYEGEGDCDILDGLEVQLIRNKCGADDWYGGNLAEGCITGMRLRLDCGPDPEDVTTWQLTLDNVDCGFVGNIILPADPSSTCVPFMLIFKVGPVENPTSEPNCPGGCNPCGQGGGADCGMEGNPPCPTVEYTITIVETPP